MFGRFFTNHPLIGDKAGLRPLVNSGRGPAPLSLAGVGPFPTTLKGASELTPMAPAKKQADASSQKAPAGLLESAGIEAPTGGQFVSLDKEWTAFKVLSARAPKLDDDDGYFAPEGSRSKRAQIWKRGRDADPMMGNSKAIPDLPILAVLDVLYQGEDRIYEITSVSAFKAFNALPGWGVDVRAKRVGRGTETQTIVEVVE